MGNELVYVVDDDQIASMITQRMLSRIQPNLTIEVFSNPEEVIRLICTERRQPDYIFLDLNMPAMNGWQFLDEVEKHIDKKSSIFILTSSIDDRDSARAKAHKQISGYLIKPIEHAALKNALNIN